MTLVEQLHLERKARLARISSRAFVPPSSQVADDMPFPSCETREPVADALFQEAWSVLDECRPRPSDMMIGIMHRIQLAVCRDYNVSRNDLLSARRAAQVVEARQVAMYLIKELTLRSLPEIGRKFGGRDHTTVLHSIRKIKARVGVDEPFAANVERIRSQFKAEEESACA